MPALRFTLTFVLLALALTPSLRAQRYWSGTGTWDSAAQNWGTASGGPYTAATWNSGTAIFEGTAGTVTPSGSLTATGLTFSTSGYNIATGSGATLTLSGTVATGAHSATLSPPIAGGSLITKTGEGMLILGSGATHTGGWAINGGTVRVASPAFLQANPGGPISFDGGTLDLSNSTSTALSTGRFSALTTNAGGATFNISNFSGVIAVQRAITGTGSVTKSGFGSLTLSAANTFSGSLTLATSGGTVTLTGSLATTAGLTVNTGSVFQLGVANGLPDSLPVTLAGGTLKTGATTGFGDTVGTLDLNNATTSTIELGTGTHTLTFAASSARDWTGSTLSIIGWSGSAGASGTAGRIFVGNSASGLTAAQLAAVTFTGFASGATLLATGELVPTSGTGGGGGGGTGGTTAIFQAPFTDALGFGGTWLDGLNGGVVARGASAQIRAGRQASDTASLARGLARWDVASLEGKFTDVTGLSLELTLATTTTATTTLQLYAVDQAHAGWNESESTKARKLQSLAYPWTGATDADGFPVLASGAVLGSVSIPSGTAAGTRVTVTLGTTSAERVALITDWIEGRRSGLLFRLADETANSAVVCFHSTAGTTLANRPKLTVTYAAGHRVWTVVESASYLSKYLSYQNRSFDNTAKLVNQGGLLYTRHSMEYAQCLVETGRSEHVTTAEAIIAAVLAQQFNNSADSLQHGYIKQYTTELAGSYNGAMHDFALGAALSIRLDHYDQLGSTAQANLNTLIQRAAAWTNVNRNPTNITNQETGAWYNLFIAGQIYGNSTWTNRGNTLFNNGGAQILANEGIHEFNSPTYTRISALNLRKLTSDLANATTRDQCRRMLRWVWAQTARHHHRPSRQWSGPMTRTYEETQFDANTRADESYTALPRYQFTAHGRDRVPAEYLAWFTDPLPAARQNVETFVKGPASPAPTDTVVNHWAGHGVVPIVGTTYLHPAFSLGTLNFGHMGFNSSGSKRPLILLWGDATSAGTSSFALLTMMKTGSGSLIETSRPLLFTSQSNGDVLAGLTWSYNSNNDSPRSTSSSFSASELRIRFMSSGAAASAAFPAPASLLSSSSRTTGGITTTLQCVYADFPGFSPTWVSSGGNLDLVIYSGTERTFNLASLARFTAAFVLRTGPAGAVTTPSATVTSGNSTASVRVGALTLLYPTQPDTISAVAIRYRDLLGTSALGAPGSLAAAAHTGGVDLYWNDLASAETGFTVQRRLGPAGAWTDLTSLPADTVAYIDTTVLPNTEYSYRARAFDGAGPGAWSIETTTVSLGAATPSPFVRIQATGQLAVVPVTLTNGASVSQTFTVTSPPSDATFTPTVYPAGENSYYAQKWDDTVPYTGTKITPLGDDEYSSAFNLNFSFPYLGRTMTRLLVSSNGCVVLGTASAFPSGAAPGGNSPYTNFALPTFRGSSDMIALLWDDLLPDADGGVYYKRVDSDGDGTPDVFIVHYENIRLSSKTTRFTAQLHLLAGGEVRLFYKDLPSSLNSYSVGLQGVIPSLGVNPPGVGVAHDTAYFSSGMAVSFAPPVTWLSLGTTSLTLAPGASSTVNLSFDSAGLANGTTRSYALPITGSAPQQPAFTLPVSLQVAALTPLQSWRQTYWGSTGNTGSGADLADPDNDGLTNFLEYAFGSTPTANASAARPTSTLSSSTLQIAFVRSRSELAYYVEGSSDLVNWTVIANNPGQVGQTVTVNDAVSLASSPRRFLRLRVVAP